MLRRRWEPLEARTVDKTPRAYGYYELGDVDGDLVGCGVGVLHDELKEALAYGDAERVRRERATLLDHAERLTNKHNPVWLSCSSPSPPTLSLPRYCKYGGPSVSQFFS